MTAAHPTPPAAPIVEGDTNASPARAAMIARTAGRNASETLARDERVFVHQALSTPCMDELVAAGGAWLTTRSGRRVLDFHGNSVHTIGHGHPAVIEAVTRQLATLPFSPRRFTNRPAVELAERLGSLTGGVLTKALFVPGGAAAVGLAMKLARLATGRRGFVTLDGAFHGASLEAASLSGQPEFRAIAGEPDDEVRVAATFEPAACDAAGCAAAGRCAGACVTEVERAIDEHPDLAAVIAEPARAATAAVPDADYWRRVRAACDRRGALLVFDEIPTALGRTGAMFAHEHSGVRPDILVLGKALGGGVFPLACVLAAPALDGAPELSVGHYTHEKSPVGAAAALATLDVIEREGLIRRATTLGLHAARRLADALRASGRAGHVRGLGMLLGVDLRDANGAPDLAAGDALVADAYERGLSFKAGRGHVAVLTPPLTITEADLDLGLDLFAESLAATAGNGRSQQPDADPPRTHRRAPLTS